MKTSAQHRDFSHHFHNLLLTWYDQYGRHNLPWKKNATPYRVWISEIMLQQTQVQTVIPYYQRFMNSFPSIKKLATASLDEVMQHWSGLGYYRRARFIHETAKRIHHDFHGRFPKEESDLMALPGIGQSTAGAIRSMAFDLPAAILDGNVKRLFARLWLIHDVAPYKKLWHKAQTIICASRPADYTQALMDLGAEICTRQPKCDICPLTKICKAYQTKKQHIYPKPKERKHKPTEKKQFFILQYKDKIILEKRPSHGIWANLCCFPEAPQVKSRFTKLPAHKHILTHVIFEIESYYAKLTKPVALSTNFKWQNINQIHRLGTPKPVQNILQSLP